MSGAQLFKVKATMVADEFIDRYMPEASGEYVKVYLYLLKNADRGADIAEVAEDLRLTEGDVERAVRYWVSKGIITAGEGKETAGERKPAARKPSGTGMKISGTGKSSGAGEISEPEETDETKDTLRSRYRSREGRTVLETLSVDSEFGQLLFIVQKYMSRILTERDQEVLAYLYDGLSLPADVIDYLVEYAVETGHANMRYIEKIGLDWASLGIRDVEAAKKRTDEFAARVQSSKASQKKKTASRGITRHDDPDSWVREKLKEQIN